MSETLLLIWKDSKARRRYTIGMLTYEIANIHLNTLIQNLKMLKK